MDDIKRNIEKKFLEIRGWKNWDEYDKILESSKLDKNIREELINISIEETKKKIGGMLFLSNLPEEVIEGLNSALDDLKAGRYTILVNDSESVRLPSEARK